MDEDNWKGQITLLGLNKLLERKLQHKNLPRNWKAKIDEYFKDGTNFIKEKEEQAKTDDTGMAQQLLDERKNSLEKAQKLIFFLNYDIDKLDLPHSIAPSGLAKFGFVIEPINQYEFVYNWCGLKGIARVEQYPESKQNFIKIEEQLILLNGDPIGEFCYKSPNENIIMKWVNNKEESENTKELYDIIKNYFKTFIDLQDDCLYDVLVLFVFQSWLIDVLSNVFYLTIMASWGSGKTTVGELVTNISRHGYFGSTSLAFIARMLDKQKITLFLDEIDSVVGEDDSEILSILRQGYRRGAKYGRCSQDKHSDPQSFDIFGAKLFSVYSNTEAALLNRSIPITLTQSTDSQLPIINSKKVMYANNLLNKLYLWYLDNVIYYVDSDDSVDYTYRESILDNRKEIYDSAISSLSTQSTGLLSQQVGRNAELGHIMAILANLIGVNLGEDKGNINITKIFKFKEEVEEERMEIGNTAILRDLCIELFNKYKYKPVYITPEGFFKVSNKYLYHCFNAKLRAAKDLGCSPEKFQGFLRELGFERPHSRKKVRIIDPDSKEDETHVRLCNIFVPTVLKKLGLSTNLLDHINGGEKLEKIEVKENE